MVCCLSHPSHALVDMLAAMLETGQLKYVPWNLCTTRDQEVHGVKKLDHDLSSIITDSTTGFLKRVGKPEGYFADVSTDLLLVEALQRRAFAFELAGICVFADFNSVSTRLMKELSRIPLAGYQRVTLEQVENADRYLFTRLAEFTAGGVGRRPDGSLPVSDGIKAVLIEPEFQFLLMQMQSRGSSSSAAGKGQRKGDRDSRSRSRRKKITDQNARNRSANETARNSKGGSQGRGKGAGKGAKGKISKGKLSRFNPALETCRTSDNRPICFGYQDGSCTSASAGQACPKGVHVCWKLGCGQVHPGKDHP